MTISDTLGIVVLIACYHTTWSGSILSDGKTKRIEYNLDVEDGFLQIHLCAQGKIRRNNLQVIFWLGIASGSLFSSHLVHLRQDGQTNSDYVVPRINALAGLCYSSLANCSVNLVENDRASHQLILRCFLYCLSMLMHTILKAQENWLNGYSYICTLS